MRTPRQFTLLLASVTALTSLAIDMSLPAVPAIERAFHLAEGHGSLTLSVFLAGYAVTPLVGGPLADRFGRRPILAVSLLLFALSALLCALAPGYTTLLLARLLQGCASGVAVALPLAIVRDTLEGAEARRQISSVVTINGFMPLVAPVLGSTVMPLGGWRTIFAAQGLFALAVCASVWFTFAESLPIHRRQRLHPASLLRNLRALATTRLFTAYSLIYALVFVCIFSFISESPLILMERMGIPRGRYTLLFALTVTGTIVGASLSGRLSQRGFPVRRMIGAGLLTVAAASLLAMALQALHLRHPATGGSLAKVLAGPYVLLLPVFCSLVCFGLVSPGVTLEALEPVPHLAGSGSGAIRSLQMIFGSASSALLAALCAHSGTHPALLATAQMSAAALLALALFLLATHAGRPATAP